MRKKIGEIIKQYRNENNLSLRDFASRTSLSHSYIFKLENNPNSELTIPSAKEIANAMHISVEELLALLDGTTSFSLQSKERIRKMEQNEDFNVRLKKALQVRGMSQAELSRKTNINEANISHYLKGTYEAKQDKVFLLSKALNVSPYWLMGLDVPMEIQEEKSNAEFVTYKKSNLVKMPVIGTIPAGTPIESIQYIDEDDYLYIPESRLRGGKEKYFLLRISDNSMNPKYLNGDVILFHINSMPNSRAEVAVMINGDDATFKQIFISENGVTLHPYNSLFDDMHYSIEEIRELPVRVLGVAQSLEYRDLRG